MDCPEPVLNGCVLFSVIKRKPLRAKYPPTIQQNTYRCKTLIAPGSFTDRKAAAGITPAPLFSHLSGTDTMVIISFTVGRSACRGIYVHFSMVSFSIATSREQSSESFIFGSTKCHCSSLFLTEMIFRLWVLRSSSSRRLLPIHSFFGFSSIIYRFSPSLKKSLND